MYKKSQITIFFILGLILLILFFLLNRFFLKEQKENEIVNFEIEKNIFENYFEQCLKLSIEKSIERYGINYIEEQIEYYSKIYFLECLSFDDFKKRGLDFEYSYLDVNISLEDNQDFKKIESKIDTDLVIKSINKRAEIEKKSVELIYPKDYESLALKGFIPIYRGIFYKYNETNKPRPLHIFIIKIDLYDPTLKFYVTPKIAPNVMTTSDFLKQNKLQLAINGGGFDIGNTNEVNGFAAYNGVPYSNPDLKPDVTMFVTQNNEIFMMPNMPSNYKYAITGFNHIIEHGKILDRFYEGDPKHKSGYDELHPRTSIGLDENEKWLNIIVVDGRNPGISEGVSALELGEIHLSYGSTNMLNMDGGGSTTLVIEDNSAPKIINTPSDGSERPVANHFGVWAEKLPDLFMVNIEFPDKIVNNGDFSEDDFNQGNSECQSPNQGSSLLNRRQIAYGIIAGSQPTKEGYDALKQEGIKTILDVQGCDNSNNIEGMRYIHLPYDNNPPSDNWITNVVSVMQDSSNYPLYLHCMWGEHRTGLAIMLYRMIVENICYNDAYNEFLKYANPDVAWTSKQKEVVFNKIKTYTKC